MQPKIYIAYSRGKSSSVTAMFYVEAHIDLYGWAMVAKEQRLSTAFFMVENFYANRTPVLYRSIEDDVYEQWITAYPPTNNAVRCPIPDSITHELERIQSQFIEEWLFFDTDPNVASELAAYRTRGLPTQAANIKYKKLNRLDKDDEVWIHKTPGTDFNVADFLEKYWHFGEKVAVR
jgi:hypothetical protein